MDTQFLGKSIKYTLSQKDVFDMPMTTLELFELLTDKSPLQPVKQGVFAKHLKKLVVEKHVYLLDDHVSSGPMIKLDIQAREARKQSQRAVYRIVEKKLKRLSRVFFIRGVFVDLSTVSANDPVKVILYVKESQISWAKRVVSWYLKLMRMKYLLDVRSVESLVEAQKDLVSAYAFLQTVPLINKNGIYEKYVSKNTWVFSFFPNYPFKKVSMGYRVVG